ncbi:MAG: class B sortase [Lachnospiraceae bacterium]|nr:class B sortase [Lachnospiraceae bacterium]
MDTTLNDQFHIDNKGHVENGVTKFTIGEFTFDTFHEYRDAQEDIKKISAIHKELDVHDPEVAVRIYTLIRDGKIHFKSPVGQQFTDHISDILADQNVDLLEDKAVVDEAEKKGKPSHVLGIALIALAAVAFSYFGVSEIEDRLTAKKYSKLAEDTQSTAVATLPGDTGEDTGEGSLNYSISATSPFAWAPTINRDNLMILPEYEALVQKNPDTVGWLTVPGTDINYPVVQKSEDNDYYLNHSFEGEDDSNGALFVDYRCDIVNEHSNTIIYGHNMNSGLMFGNLDAYLDQEYYNTHKKVTFNTIYEHRTYEIVAVCLSRVEYQDDNSYRYYNFIQAENQAEWDAFVNNVSRLSIFSKKIDLTETDKVLTLSTCNSYTEDGRLFVVAKRIE